jgi:hypothetical protein
MSSTIEYNGYLIEPTTRLKNKADGWTLQVRITPAGRRTGVRLCRASNTYPSETVAHRHCLEFGRRIVDGKLRPRTARGN